MRDADLGELRGRAAWAIVGAVLLLLPFPGVRALHPPFNAIVVDSLVAVGCLCFVLIVGTTGVQLSRSGSRPSLTWVLLSVTIVLDVIARLSGRGIFFGLTGLALIATICFAFRDLVKWLAARR